MFGEVIMKKYILVIFSLVIFLIFITLCFILSNLSVGIVGMKADNGTLDLSKIDIDNRIVNLNGEWEIYWGELLSPQDLENTNNREIQYYKINNEWESLGYPSQGYATFRLKIITKNSSKKMYSLLIPEVFTAYRLWVNSEEMVNNGIVSKNKKDEEPNYLSRQVFFNPEKEYYITLQISNHHFRSGGISFPIKFSTAGNMNYYQQLQNLYYQERYESKLHL